MLNVELKPIEEIPRKLWMENKIKDSVKFEEAISKLKRNAFNYVEVGFSLRGVLD